jgi:hypothetical protein
MDSTPSPSISKGCSFEFSGKNDSLQVIDSFAERADKISLLLNSLRSVKNSEGFLGICSKVKEDLAALKAEFYTIRELSFESEQNSQSNSSILDRVQEYYKRISELEMKFRSARDERSKDLLLGDTQGNFLGISRRNPKKFNEHSQEEATAKIAATLDNLLEIVTVEAERSGKSVGKMAESSNLLKKTRDEFKGFESLLQTSKQLIHQLRKGERKDLLMILGAFLVFFFSVIWVFKVRVLGNVGRIFGI